MRTSRRWKLAVATLPALAALLAAPGMTAAHAELVSTEPADGANLDQPPTEVVITFDGELQEDGSGFVVSDAEGAEVGAGSLDLDVADRNVLRGAVTIAQPGAYTVDWTVIAADGDEQTGTFMFGYQARPDTALMPPHAGSPAVPAGVAILLAGLVVGARRAIHGLATAAR
jgi:methionine-rich copper-binding protein CopC